MKFAILDPRPNAGATEANDKIFKLDPVIGVEVTIPALASRCWYNIDPQHYGGDASRAAIEVVLEAVVNDGFLSPNCLQCGDSWANHTSSGPDCGLGKPTVLPNEYVVATIRPDLDSVGAMAILKLASEGTMYFSENRVRQIATADKFARGGWPGPKPLPSTSNPWDESSASAESSRPLAAIAAAVADFRVPIADRVATMEQWLMTGEEPASYRAQVERERNDMIAALESGAIRHEVRCDGKIAVVESTHRAATSVGYALAPVVVALNPAFRQGPGEPYRKFTVCAFEARFADIKSALAELATLEPGWGGSPTIGGSPQGVSSKLTIDQVVEVVSRHLK